MTVIDFASNAQSMQERLVERRREFHRHPELAFEEHWTSGRVADYLHDLGLEIQTGVGGTGVVAILEGGNDGPTVLVRSDMDALPVEEATGAEYKSQIAGTMHACGHDGHMSVVLGAAELLLARQHDLAGRVKFVFQPAEEIGQGAAAMVRDGVLSHPSPNYSIGLHLWNELPIGQVALDGGPVMAAVSDFEIIIEGKGGHAGIPHEAIDPVICAAHIVTAFQTIVSRTVSPQDAVVLSVTMIEGGSAKNVIPTQAKMSGTLRTFDVHVRDQVVERMQAIAQGIASGMKCHASLNIAHHTVPVINDADLAEKVHRAWQQQDLSLEQAHVMTMAGEDFSEFTQGIPGIFFFVGSANAKRGLNYPHHHAKFDIDEASLVTATALLASAVSAVLTPDEQDN
ncbi:MAG: amidohydrolase [Anaerolineae bacterium]|nr:amidohydrolase [Anaerolineae bacterium]